MPPVMPFYYPNWQSECHVCGTSPTVVVAGHKVPETQLCGLHFFEGKEMSHWENWNESESEDSK